MDHVKAAVDLLNGNERDRQWAQVHATLAVADAVNRLATAGRISEEDAHDAISRTGMIR